MLIATLLLLQCNLVAAQVWAHKGDAWLHPNGMSLVLSKDFTVTQSKSGVLSALAKGGFVNLTFTPVHGKKEMGEVMGSVQEVFNIRKVELETETHTSKQNGLSYAFQDGKTVINDIDYLVKLGIYNKKDEFLVMQLLVPRTLLPKAEDLLRKALGSVR